MITIEEFIREFSIKCLQNKEKITVNKIAIEFAKLHVTEALSEAAKSANTNTEEEYNERKGEYFYYQVIYRESILGAYDLDNIK